MASQPDRIAPSEPVLPRVSRSGSELSGSAELYGAPTLKILESYWADII